MREILILILITLLVPVVGCEQRSGANKNAGQDLSAMTPKVNPIKSLNERKLSGPVLMYYDNGQLKAERVYKDAKLNGVYRTYYENGQLKVDGTYKDDKMDGVFRHYDKNGRLEVEEIYRDNIPMSRKVLNNS